MKPLGVIQGAFSILPLSSSTRLRCSELKGRTMTQTSKPSILADLWLATINLALGLAGGACLGLGVMALASGKEVSVIATALTAGLALLLAASIERFEVLKGLGVEARTKRLDAAISQATATLEQLRELAELSSDFVVPLVVSAGHWDSATPPKKAYETVQRIKTYLKGLGSADETVKKSLQPWVEGVTNELVQKLLQPIWHQLELGVQEFSLKLRNYDTTSPNASQINQEILEGQKKFIDFRMQGVGDPGDWTIGSHSRKLRRIVETMPLLNESERSDLLATITPWLPRLEYLATNLDLLDKEEWFDKLKPADGLSALRFG